MDFLAELEAADQFVARHIGPSDADIAAMLRVIGRASLDDAAAAAVPEAIRSNQAMNLPPAVDEAGVLAELRELAARNVVKKSLIGMGYHGTVTPPVILRNVLENPGWYTAYTPYQAEIAQGRLEALVNFQTLICELTGMEIANASLLDEATAAAEAWRWRMPYPERNPT
jgi:glycine dehydrogenase